MTKRDWRSGSAHAGMFVALLWMAGASVATAATSKTHTVTVNADGSFAPPILLIHDGDTVVWHLHHAADAIIPVDTAGTQDRCAAYKPYHPNGANEFTGPLPRTPSGIFALGPDGGPGFVVKSSAAQCDTNAHPECGAASVGSGATTQCLCATGKPYSAMDSTWGDPDITGVFVRLPWSAVHKGPGEFFWDDLDREIDQAVKNGKLYSLAFQAGTDSAPGKSGSLGKEVREPPGNSSTEPNR